MAWLDKLHHPEKFIKTFLKWGLLGLIMGALGGLIGAGFHHALHFVTHLRGEHSWLIFLLPVGGLLTVTLYKVLKLQNNKGTNEIIDATLDGHPVSPAVFPGIFLATAMTHLFGGSAGREGAALQLGGSTASLLAKIFRLDENERKVMVMSGMAAVFAGLFGTPLTAALFCMEFESVGTVFSPALLPCFLAAFVASRVSLSFGVHAEGLLLETSLGMDVLTLGKVALLAVAVSVLGIFMCAFFHKAEHFAKQHVANPYIRIAVGGVIVMVMTLIVGDHRFNGAGMDMALKAVAGQTDWYNFILKMVFTAVTLAAGFKGGEIVPTFCVGATFGCLLGGLLGLDAGICGALGLIGLFCCATNSPIASIVLSIEMFGGANLYLFALVCVICFVLSGNSGLYASQIIEFNKADLKENHFDRVK
ncbi:MAG: chloride channel protein [Ruminococcaceae bacterium]|nr:chloride channel protein [Oscillospiraceae bacterium]